MRITYAGYKYELDGSAVRVFFDPPDAHKSAQTHCPSCDGYGFHRGYCNIVNLYPNYFRGMEIPGATPRGGDEG